MDSTCKEALRQQAIMNSNEKEMLLRKVIKHEKISLGLILFVFMCSMFIISTSIIADYKSPALKLVYIFNGLVYCIMSIWGTRQTRKGIEDYQKLLTNMIISEVHEYMIISEVHES